jgi:hypothetical protein
MQIAEVNGHIRFDDVEVKYLKQDAKSNDFDTQTLPLVHTAPPQYENSENFEVIEWLSGVFIKLDLLYDKNRRE